MEDKEFYDLKCNVVEIKTDMKHIRRAAEGFNDISGKVNFHNKFIWMLLSIFSLSSLATVIYVGRLAIKKYLGV